MSANDCADICATSPQIQLQTVRVISGGGALCGALSVPCAVKSDSQCPEPGVSTAITDNMSSICADNVIREVAAEAAWELP